MGQTTSIITTLKSMLKSRGITYRQVGQEMGLSEASIKRLFAENNFSLRRLDQMCHLLDIEISDLIKNMEAEQQQISELSENQEEELVADVKLLLVAFLVINGLKFEDILAGYELSEHETVRFLARLDRIKMIELFPGNRIRLRISPKFSWRCNGPIQKFFSTHLQKDFMHSQFDSKQETLQFPSGMLSQSSAEQLNRRIKQLIQDFHSLNEQDRRLPLDERVGYSMLLAFRPWRPDVFEKLKKKIELE